MRTLILLLCWVCSVSVATAKDYQHYRKLINAIAEVESHGNPRCNSGKGDIGILQQRMISVKEANRIVGYNKYKSADRYNPKKQVEMFMIIQNHYNPSGNYEVSSRLWNGMDKHCRKQSTKAYWQKVQVALAGQYAHYKQWE